MNILYFLTPKSETAFLNADSTVRQALEKMRFYGYSAIPLVDGKGHYAGTIAEGDFLWGLMDRFQGEIHDLDHTMLRDIPRRHDLQPVHIDAQIDEMLERALHQNFVPVVDDNEIFIGIVRRQDILQFYLDAMRKTECHWRGGQAVGA
ncbi:MAG: CBS domain-containing protein [Lachnospiraceae bacterium]|nr:CBS domain-containing protein [Lachnospiraceae bacterium]